MTIEQKSLLFLLYTKTIYMRAIIFILAIITIAFWSCEGNRPPEQKKYDISTVRRMEGEELVNRGQYLVTIGGCNDCHTPKIFNDHGFTLDSSRLLSGHPSGSPALPIDERSLKPGNWMSFSPDLTTFVGPWGMSHSANLTPDSATGTGAWTEENFVQTLRKGKHLGTDNGRPLMPPMPWEMIRNLTDEDMSAVFAYIRSLPAINNKVPAPISNKDAYAMAMAAKKTIVAQK
jgi:mono/diheme cytochrome c family protein